MDLKPKKRSTRKVVSQATPEGATTKTSSTTVTIKKTLPKRTNRATLSKKESVTKAKATSNKTHTTKRDLETVSFISGNVSLRLKEKAKIYHDWYQQNSPDLARPATLVFGYIFIVMGFLFVYALMLPTSSYQAQLMANVICNNIDCGATSGLSTTTDSRLRLKPMISFLTQPQVEAGKDTEVSLLVQNSRRHYFQLISRETGQKINLEPSAQTSDDKYSYQLPTKTLAPGEYRILVRAESLDGITKAEFPGPLFRVPVALITPTSEAEAPKTVNDDEEEKEEAIANTTDSNASSSVKTETAEEEQSNDPSVLEPTVREYSRELNELKPEELLKTTDQPKITEDLPKISDNRPTTTVTERALKKDMQLYISPGSEPNQHRIFIIPTYQYTTMEIYARAENSTQRTFLGIPTLTDKGWLYWLDGNSLPAGKYKIVVQAYDSGEFKTTAETKFENVPQKSVYLGTPEYRTKQEIIKKEIKEIANATSSDSSNLSSLIDPRQPLLPKLIELTGTTSTADVMTVERIRAREVLVEFSPDFNDLLRRYASALQSDNQVNLRLTEKEFDEKVDAILTDKVLESEFEDSIHNLNHEIKDELKSIKKQVKKVEELKTERTKETSSLDTDGDGIPDYDEYLLYGTDPKSPDTDDDGVIDGVEVSRGFDPLNTKPEAIIEYASPKEVSYVDNSLLQVQSVSPLLVHAEEQKSPVVQSEITGFGLPNSFVTLYIFSDPIVVTLKTKDDGSFSYTFSKELEDGEHEVYAALTDNQGQIVVRSEPFRFVKQAEAFTYVETPEELPIVPADENSVPIEKTYNIVAAMGVVAFGLILLLLGQTIRPDRLKVITTS